MEEEISVAVVEVLVVVEITNHNKNRSLVGRFLFCCFSIISLMSSSDSFVTYILDELASITDLRARRMFGGYGLYAGDAFFGIVSDGVLYLKTDEKTRGRFIALGKGPFRPSPKQTLKNYYEVPEEVIESREVFLEIVKEAVSLPRRGVGA